MVRCEDFYKFFEKKGNFCGKSDAVAKKVEDYIAYVKRNRMGTYKISNCALDPFINIEYVNEGVVHRNAIKELKSSIKRGKVLPEKVTRRMSIEIINRANNSVGNSYRLDRIPGVRSRMGDYEHDVGSISSEARDMFDDLKKDIGIRNNDQAMKIMMECCIRNIHDVKGIKENIEKKEKAGNRITIAAST